MGRARWQLLAPGEARRALATIEACAALLALVALVDLGLRAALRLNLRWDTFAYHLPFAARLGGLKIPYEMNDLLRPTFGAYPILPELLQGLLWRITGSINATGVINYLAFAVFLVFAQRAWRAPFWLVALVSLTAPLVVIHLSSSYVDLFGNAFLALGVCSCLALYLEPDAARPVLVYGAPAALAAAAWSKYLLAPLAGLSFVLLAFLLLERPQIAGLRRRHVAGYCVALALVASAPYVKNWIVFGNPFWPLRVPLVGDWFPYTNDALRGALHQRPATHVGSGPIQLFLASLFEIDQPTSYPNRLRWVLDQGGTSAGFRMGGYWGVAAGIYSLLVAAMLGVCHGRRGWAMAVLLMAGTIAFGLVPQAHELRYYMFIPLSGAGIVAMLYPRLARSSPGAAMALLALVLGLFVHMLIENAPHYLVSRVDGREAARQWGASRFWPELEHGKVYCAVDMLPIGMLLTGPTLSEYVIIDRSRAELCPPGSVLLHNLSPSH